MKLVIISDTHDNRLQDLPPGDVLIHCGDLTNEGRLWETQKMLKWLAYQKDVYSEVILVAGNHDFIAQREAPLYAEMCADWGITYLNDSTASYKGVKFYGSPWTPKFYDWAFMESEADLARRFARIPEDTDVLITHGPPRFILDQNEQKEHCGSQALLDRVFQVAPKVHCFGHIHTSHGETIVNGVHFINAAVTNDYNRLSKNQKPRVVNI